MHPLFTFILGLLIGWLIEWLIDYFYWRRRYTEKETRYVDTAVHAVHADRNPAPAVPDVDSRPVVQAHPDDLKIIKGIGTVIERKLNEAGIYTFAQLGNLTPADLRRILGSAIERLANEESLLQQARDLARRK
jgi:predicted flap endonuclease-1-like 5' DNA nuclease